MVSETIDLSNDLEEEDDSSEERYTIAETNNNIRASRARSRLNSDLNNNTLSLELDNKLMDNQQLLLLCNPKDMIILNNHVETKRKGMRFI